MSIDPDSKIHAPNPSYTNESLSRTDFLRTVRDPERCPSMQWSLLLLFLVEKATKIFQSKSIPDVYKLGSSQYFYDTFAYETYVYEKYFNALLIYEIYIYAPYFYKTLLKYWA